jgi:hypothetical protein
MSDDMANTLRQVKPKFFIDWIPYFKTTAQFKQQNPELFQNFSKEKTQIITNLNLENKQEKDFVYHRLLNQIKLKKILK